MSLAQSYTLADVKNWYGMQELNKAKPYFNSINYLDVQFNKITAQVKGTAARPYQVEIIFDTDPSGKLRILPSCSCPVGWKCKHTAVVLLSALAVPKVATVNPSVVEWVESFRRAVQFPPKEKKSKPSAKNERLCYALTVSSHTGAYTIVICKGRMGADGRLLGGLEEWDNVERALIKPPQYVTDEDLSLYAYAEETAGQI